MSTDTDPARAFAYLSDFETTTEWDPGTVRTVRESGDGGVGTRYRNTSTFLGRTSEVVYSVVELQPGRRIVLRGENAGLVVLDTITVTPRPAGGCEVVYHADFDFQGWVRFLQPVLALGLQRLGDQAERGLAEALRGR